MYIFHNYYFRFGAWVGEGVNWCAPYKGWQKVYENSPMNIIKQQGYLSKKHLILGNFFFSQ